jgi:D-arabinose 1-dehydrogenase-like Zn-dependent alcohol dehydrogenase
LKAAVLKAYLEPLSVEEVPDPKVEGPWEVVVRVAGSGVCHTDLHVWRGEAEAVLNIKLPLILGHEPSGVVEEVGDGVPERFKPGTPVLVCAGSVCEEEDEFTVRGEFHLCSKPAWLGLSHRHGSHAEKLHVPHYRYLVPAHGLEDLEAASLLTDAGVTAYRAVKRASIAVEPDDFVAVVGLGGVGLFGAQLAKRLLGARVVAVDVRDEKLEFAEKAAGLDSSDVLVNASRENVRRVVEEATRGRGVKAVLDFVGLEEAMADYLSLLAKKGVYVVVGLGSPFGSRVPSLDLILGERWITGVLWGPCKDVAELAALARRGLVDYRSIVTRRLRLDEINDAFERLERGEVLGRQVVVFR